MRLNLKKGRNNRPIRSYNRKNFSFRGDVNGFNMAART